MIKINRKLFADAKTLNVACSMGEDSVAISHYLANGKRPLILHYVNHGTEYALSAQSKFQEYLEFLRGTARVKVEGVIHRDPSLDSSDFGEAEFREYRYSKFDDYFKNKKDTHQYLIVCHHLGDAVENFIMSMFTAGSTKRQLKEVTTRNAGYTVIRPILTTKQDIKDYIKRHDLEKWVVTDPSNTDNKFKRNWVRNELIPKIKEGYPGIETVVKKLYLNNEFSETNGQIHSRF